MKSVCVLGNGQLGRMLRQAGELLGITVYPIGLNTQRYQIPRSMLDSVITVEIEQWPETDITRMLANQNSFINRDIIPIIADRLLQKQLLNHLGLTIVPWQFLSNINEWKKIFSSLGSVVIVKRRSGSYDGRNQWRFRAQDIKDIKSLPDNCYGQCIVEKNINFLAEVSLIGARSYDGNIVFYPLTYNLHHNNILQFSVVPAQINILYQRHAEFMLSMIMHELNYIGIMAMECFVTPTGLVINELAPRVHNSGHWTQNGASISQFELHLRAILDMPLPTPVVNNPAVMINLIGIEINFNWLQYPLVHLHWYEKKVRYGRKVGHLNLANANSEALSNTLHTLMPLLPNEYHIGISWVIEKLMAN